MGGSSGFRDRENGRRIGRGMGHSASSSGIAYSSGIAQYGYPLYACVGVWGRARGRIAIEARIDHFNEPNRQRTKARPAKIPSKPRGTCAIHHIRSRRIPHRRQRRLRQPHIWGFRVRARSISVDVLTDLHDGLMDYCRGVSAQVVGGMCQRLRLNFHVR